MEMASSLEEGPPNTSFAIRDTAIRFPRSASTKEAAPCDAVCLPPRLSAAGASSLSLSQPSTPRGLSFPVAKPADGGDPAAYRVVSSVLKKDGQILCVAAANDLVYTGSQASAVRVWKLPEFAECGQLKAKVSMVVALQVTNDRVYAAYADCKIRVWRRMWEGDVRHVKVATVPPTGSFVLSYIGGKDRMTKHLGPISSMAISTSEDILYSASLDKTVKVWRISDFRCIETIQAHPEPINALALADDGVLYTASDDATVRVWRRNFFGAGAGTRLHSLIVTLPAKHSPVRTLALAQDGAVLYGGCTDGYVHYWLRGWFSGQLQYGGALAGHTHAVMCLATVGDYVVSGSADATGRVWVRETDGFHTCIAVLQGHRGPIRCVAALPDRAAAREEGSEEGCTLCTGSLDGVIKVWRVWNTVDGQARAPSLNAREYFELT